MKKFVYLVSVIFCFMTLQSFANVTDLQLTTESRSNAQDRIWTGAFQVAWDDFKSKVVFDVVHFATGTPTIAQDLNNSEYLPEYVPTNSYYKIVAKSTKATKKKILKKLKKRFNEPDPFAGNIDLKIDKHSVILYSIFKKDLVFAGLFDELGCDVFGDNQQAKYIGVGKNSERNFGENISVLFYNSEKDFAISLNTQDGSVAYFYKSPSNKPFYQLYTDIMMKTSVYKGNTNFSEADELKIPYLAFNKDYYITELCGKRIKGTNLILDNATESIRFTISNSGKQIQQTDAPEQPASEVVSQPRFFYLNDSFVLFLKDKHQPAPYFALRVNDITNYQ